MPIFKKFLRRVKPLVLLTSLLVSAAQAQSVHGWGFSYYGQLDVPANAQHGVALYRAGSIASFALKNGAVIAWGDNYYGELNIPAEAQSGVTDIQTGANFVLALKEGGVLAWGINPDGAMDVPEEARSGVTAIAGGGHFSLALKDGGVIQWGTIPFTGEGVPLDAQSGVTAIAGTNINAFVLKDGRVFGWGYNFRHSLEVPAEAQSDVIAISGGVDHIMALTSYGRTVVWGYTNPDANNVPDAAQTGVIAIAAGAGWSLVLKEDGSVVAWGLNYYDTLNIPADANPLISVSVSSFGGHAFGVRPAAWATLDQSEVASNGAATGTVHLDVAAGPGGQKVYLTSDNANVHVPAFAVVRNGQSTVTFPVTTNEIYGPDVVVRVRTSYNGTGTVAAKLTLKGSSNATLAFNRPGVIGGSTAKETVTLTLGSAVGATTTFTLSSSNPGLVPDTSVTVLAGHTTGKVTLTHNLLSDKLEEPVTIDVSSSSTPIASGSLLVYAFRASLTLESSTITAGASTNVLVTLNATPRDSLTINPWASDGNVTFPDSATIGAGTKTGSFPISVAPFAPAAAYSIGANVNGNYYFATLRVRTAPSIASVSLGSTMFGSSKIVGTVRLSRTAYAGGTVVQLSATDGLTVPASVMVPAGTSTATFDVTASDVDAAIIGQVSAFSAVNQVDKLISVKPLAPASFTLSATTLGSESSFEGTITLVAAPTFDAVVQLTSSNPLVTVPETVTVFAGSKTATFTGTVGTVTKVKNITLTATRSGKSLSKPIKVQPVL